MCQSTQAPAVLKTTATRPWHHAPVRLLLGTSLRPVTNQPAAESDTPRGPRLCAERGFDGLAIDGGFCLEQVPFLATAAARIGVRIGAMFVPFPLAPLAEDKRLPHLCAHDDGEERHAAVGLARKIIEAGRHLGIPLFAIDFGSPRLAVPEADLRRRFACAEMDEGDPGDRVLKKALADRKEKDERIFDACRSALEALIETAVITDSRLALQIAGTPWRAPGPRQALALLREFSGAPIGLVFSPARLHTLESLGLGVSAARQRELRAAAILVHATDAVGIDDAFLPGLGEASLSDLLNLPRDIPVVISGRPSSSDAEIATAAAVIRDFGRPGLGG